MFLTVRIIRKGVDPRPATIMEGAGLLFLAVLFAFGGLPADSSINVDTCRELGFSSNLLCSSCDELKRFKLDAIEEECRQCCQQSAKEEKVPLIVYLWRPHCLIGWYV